ncbi:MAG: putative quinol monooxygenase [Pseudomonadota bacterium]
MKSEQYSVLAVFKARPGKEEELKRALQEMVEPTLAEEGCINYDLHQSVDNKAQFMFYENWSNQAAHSQHNVAAHIEAWRKKKDQLLEENCVVTAWKMININDK